jgi:hypothetical protein
VRQAVIGNRLFVIGAPAKAFSLNGSAAPNATRVCNILAGRNLVIEPAGRTE